MKLWHAVFLMIVLCLMLGGCPESPSIQAAGVNVESEQIDTTEQILEEQVAVPSPVFSVKEYVNECTLLTRSQQLCDELGRNLQNTLKDNFPEDADQTL